MSAITLIGPGAIGGMVAAQLCQNPRNDVTVVARTPFSKLWLDTPDGELLANPRIVSQPGDTGPADWVLVATKAYDSESAAAWFASLVGEWTTVAVLQNGVNHVERFSAWLPRERILPVIVDCPTERVAAGHIRQRGPALLTVPSGELADRFQALFADTGVTCKQSDDFTSMAWWKLCINAAGVVNALVLQPARIARDEAAAKVMRAIVEETAAVGRAEGAQLSPDIADEVIDIYRGQPPDSVNSLHADRAAGRPMELDLRNGVIVELGRKHGIATPYNDMAVSLLKIS
jgi:2-dehydropantoate 2-reductase